MKELGVEFEIIEPEDLPMTLSTSLPDGLILSGGPASVYADGAPTIDPVVFSLDIPILGICYGLMLMSHLLGGKVAPGKKEYGPASLVLNQLAKREPIVQGVPDKTTVWMSHGDEVIAIPAGYKIIGSTADVRFAFVKHQSKNIFGLQFHPEVQHTQSGAQIYENFVRLCGVPIGTYTHDPEKLERQIKKQVGDTYVIGAVSGGVDSTVAGILTAKAIGRKFLPIYVENGLMRHGTKEDVAKIFRRAGAKPIIVHAEKEMLSRLEGVSDPEKKRKIIGSFYIEVFEREMKKLSAAGKPPKFLLQGTIYSDVIESKGTKHADKIKSHHNVGGLPEKIKLQLLEPLRDFYKDEVREIGTMLGIPPEFVQKQKFPGPGYGIRIRGEVTPERLAQCQQADAIVLEELAKAGWLDKVFHSFPVMTGAQSTSVKGDGRFFGEVVALRITTSTDEMTCGWAHLPYELLQRLSSRIVNEVPRVSRVVYDITTKPPSTMEWE